MSYYKVMEKIEGVLRKISSKKKNSSGKGLLTPPSSMKSKQQASDNESIEEVLARYILEIRQMKKEIMGDKDE